MLIDRPQVVEGSVIVNATVPSGPALPSSPGVGELFYLTAVDSGLNPGFVTYGNGAWRSIYDQTLSQTPGEHIADATIHITAVQNTFLDGLNLPSLTAAEVNFLDGTTSNVQTQFNTLTSNLATHVADLSVHLTAAQNSLLDALNATSTELNYSVGVTSPIQTQLNAITSLDTTQNSRLTTLENVTVPAVQSNLTTHINDLTVHLTAAQNTLLDGLAATLTSAELNFVDGVTSPIQTQLNTLAGSSFTQKLSTNGTIAMAADLSMGGFKITNVAIPTNPNDVATKDYVDSFVQGLHWVGSVATATTGNIALSGLQTIDGVVLNTSDRVLVKNQASTQNNGIYLASAGAWSRSNDYNSAIEITSSAVFVLGGSTQNKSTWVQTAVVNVLGTDPISFSAFSGPVINSAGGGITLGVNGMVSVNEGAGLTFDGANALVVDVYAGGGLMVTTNNVSAATLTTVTAQLALTESGVTAGTYNNAVTAITPFTVDSKGRITGTGGAVTITPAFSSITGKPTTLAGYGITDAQGLDSDLTALANTAGTGIYVVTGTGTSATRSVVAPASGITITNGSGVAGNPTLVLANDLGALEALAGTGFAVRTATDTWAQRLFAVAGVGLSISNPDGVAGNVTITSNATSANTASTIIARDASGNFVAGTITANLSGNATTATTASSTTGNAGTATTLQTARNISLTGAATGTATSFNGSADIAIPVTALNASNLNAGTVPAARLSGTYAITINSPAQSNFQGNQGSVIGTGTGSLGGIMVQGDGTNAAFMSFHRPGVFAAYLGIDTDNQWKVGGWSMGAASYTLYHSGNITISSSAGVANRVVQADSNGYIFNTYFNSSDNAQGSGITAVMVKAGDNYLRSGTAAGVAAFVGPSITSLGTIATIAGVSPVNGAIRLTPNLHLNSGSGTSNNAVILNWDNGASAGNQQVRIGNGAGVDAWYVTTQGNVTQTGSLTATGQLQGTALKIIVGSGGELRAQSGGASNTGYIEFYRPGGATREGYIGFVTAGGAINYVSETAGAHSFSGSITASGDITAFSDRRLKTDIEPIHDPLKKIEMLNGVTFKRIDTGDYGTGLIAQDVQEAMPNAVAENENGLLSVAYGNLAGLFVEAIKALNKEVAELRAELAALKGQQ